MEVTDKLIIDNNHSLEWGASTWDKDDFSIRNRFDSDEGRFNKAGSSEIPWADFNTMILESLRRNHFSRQQIAEITNEIGQYIARQ